MTPVSTSASAPTLNAKLTPSDEQRRAIQRLTVRAQRHLGDLSLVAAGRSLHPCDGEPAAMTAMKTPRVSNAIGVFGRRGSGKTTVLVDVLRNLAKPAAGAPSEGWYVVRMPLDLSYAPSEFPVGLSVLHWVHDALQEPESEEGSSPKAEAAFQKASQSCFRGASGFNSLVRDLSVTADHYTRAAASEITKRRELWKDIRAWLDAEAKARKVVGFVVAVDDIDLAPANAHHSLIWAMLDELHQDRLFFLLAGDLNRLENRLAEEDAFMRRKGTSAAELDIQTARDLVYKVVPQVDRREIGPWDPERRMAFPPAPAGDGPEATRPATIEELSSQLPLRPVIRRHLPYLLPPWARGLENVRRELEQNVEDLKSTTGPVALSSADQEAELLGFLAESTFDFELARRLRDRRLGDWAATWRWAPLGTAPEAAWAAVTKRLANKDEDDLIDLLPDPTFSDPKLGIDRARWAEVLLDVAISEDRLGPSSLVGLVPLLQARAASCQASVDRSWESLDQLIADGGPCLVAALAWTQWNTAAEQDTVGHYDVGLPSVLLLAAGRASPWPDLVERKFMVTRADLLRGMAGDAKERLESGRASRVGVDFLPSATRPLLHFLDRVARQPWVSLALLYSKVGPLTQARAAACFVYQSLREQAVEESRAIPALPGLEWPDEQSLGDLCARFRTKDSGQLQRIREDEVAAAFRRVAALASEDRATARSFTGHLSDLHERRATYPNLVALEAYLGAPFFVGLDPAVVHASPAELDDEDAPL
jgi:hypothetical protein